MAVIYRQHKQARNIIKLLEEKKIPVIVQESVNILDLPFTKMILNVFSYVAGEFKNPYSMESVLFHILHYEFFSIPVRDIAMLCAKLRQLEKEHKGSQKEADMVCLPTLEPRLREIISDETLVRNMISVDAQEKVLKFGEGLKIPGFRGNAFLGSGNT